MRMSWKLLSAALIASGVPFIAGSAGAAPLSSPLALQNADTAPVETVRWRRGRWVGPAAGFAAGVAVGSAFAPRYYDYPYGAYAYSPGYAYVPARRYRGYWGYACTGDAEVDSANPSWACPYSR